MRDKHADADNRNNSNCGNNHKGIAPGKMLPDPGTDGNTNKICYGQPHEHECNRPYPLRRRNHIGSNDRTNTEEGAVSQRRDDPAQNGNAQRGRKGRNEVTRHKQQHQENQHGFSGHF